MGRSRTRSAGATSRFRAVADRGRAADDDPFWTLLFTIPFMAILQEMSARVGMITGMGPARVMRSRYSRPILIMAVSLLVVANTFSIGADLGAMGDATRLIWPLPFPLWLTGITTLSLMLEIFLTYNTYATFLNI